MVDFDEMQLRVPTPWKEESGQVLAQGSWRARSECPGFLTWEGHHSLWMWQ